MRTARRILQWMLCGLVVGCASPLPAAKPLQVEPPKLPPAPPDVMVERQPDFLRNLMQRFSFQKPVEPTK
jgi:hypothetical protein